MSNATLIPIPLIGKIPSTLGRFACGTGPVDIADVDDSLKELLAS